MTYERWAESVPESFRFSVKAPKTITHEKRLTGTDELLQKFFDEALGLGQKLGCVLIQLPPSLEYEKDLVENFFGVLRPMYEGVVVIEPRHRTWFAAGTWWAVLPEDVPLSLAFAVGVAVPFAVHGVDDVAQRDALVALVLAGVALTAVFTSLAFVIAVRTDDRLRALGTAIAVWLALALLYDGAVLLAAALFADYPLERALLGATLANPVDLARVLLLLQLDVGALMGYTGAAFQQFFGTIAGTAVASAALVAWIAGPIVLGLRAFSRKDF